MIVALVIAAFVVLAAAYLLLAYFDGPAPREPKVKCLPHTWEPPPRPMDVPDPDAAYKAWLEDGIR